MALGGRWNSRLTISRWYPTTVRSSNVQLSQHPVSVASSCRPTSIVRRSLHFTASHTRDDDHFNDTQRLSTRFSMKSTRFQQWWYICKWCELCAKIVIQMSRHFRQDRERRKYSISRTFIFCRKTSFLFHDNSFNRHNKRNTCRI